MTSPSPGAERAADLALMVAAAQAAGEELRARFGKPLKTWSKGCEGPVSEADFAANEALESLLRRARPDYGWLSEETADDGARLARAKTFIVDPLDGTIAYLKGGREFCVAVGLVDLGVATLGVIHAPLLEATYAGGPELGVTRNGATVAVTETAAMEGATLLAPPALFQDRRWPEPWPPVTARKVPALALRLALVAAGEADGVIALGAKSEWDIAAGAALVLGAGGLATDPWDAPLRFNQSAPKVPGVVAAGARLHPLLAARTRVAPRPEIVAAAEQD